MGKSISISLLGDEAYRDAVSVVARRHKQDMGALVRESLDRTHGVEIQEVLSFFENSVESIQQSLNDTPEAAHV